MADVTLSPRESDFMRHALGWSSGVQSLGYRNYFVVGGGTAVETWDGLLSRGLAGISTDKTAYYVTAAGLDALGAYGLTITKRMREARP